MDKVLSRNVIMCYRKLLSHHHHQCIRFKQLGSLQHVTAEGSLYRSRQCHGDASSRGSVQKGLIQEEEIKEDKQKEGGEEDKGDNGLTPSPQNRSVQSQSSFDTQGNMKENSDDTKPTISTPIVEGSSISLTSSSSSGGSNKNNSSSGSSENTLASDDGRSRRKEPPVAPDPETCCESGCVNCVWIKYAEEVKDYYPDDQDHQERLKEILDLIEDYNVKMFVRMELGMKK